MYSNDSDWFTVKSNKDGTHWSGRCWYMHELLRYEFEFEFEVPATYPAIAPEIQIPELDGKTGACSIANASSQVKVANIVTYQTEPAVGRLADGCEWHRSQNVPWWQNLHDHPLQASLGQEQVRVSQLVLIG